MDRPGRRRPRSPECSPVRAPSLPLRLARIVTGLAVVLSLSIPLHGPGHGMVGGHGSARGEVAADAVHGAGEVHGHGHGHETGPWDSPHHGSHTSTALAHAADPGESDSPLPLCLCCPGPCACPPGLALRTTGESCGSPASDGSHAVIRWAAEAPITGPVPYSRPWPTAPPTLPG